MRLRFVLTIAGALLATAGANAQQPCVTFPTVQVSAIPGNNTQYGGHLTVHIAGMTPPPGQTQNGRTMFSSTADYDEAWADLNAQAVQINCAVNPHVGSEAARDTNTQLFSRQCTAANGHGVCTASHPVQTNRATFVFRAVNLDGHVRWILFTAYPRPN